jgi:hypothetical protein
MTWRGLDAWAMLQGTAVSHADVVVSSQGAVLLALSKTDFLHAFKAILGLRQQVSWLKSKIAGAWCDGYDTRHSFCLKQHCCQILPLA